MKVSGFTFVRNAIKYDYPVVESIRSVLPLCDEMVVAVGRSEDGTRDLVLSIGDPKIRIVDTVWNEQLREGGRVLAVETDKALAQLSAKSTWAVYIQADEVLHEQGYPAIRDAMEHYAEDAAVEGLLLNYRHFWGSYRYVGDSRRWYRREVRVVRNDPAIRSWRDAQGFRKRGEKLWVAEVGAYVHHYGWVKPPRAQQAKLETFHRYWHSDRWIEKSVPKSDGFDYSTIDSLTLYTGTHPAVMQERIASQDWVFEPDPARMRRSVTPAFLSWMEKHTGWRPGEYRNYRVVR